MSEVSALKAWHQAGHTFTYRQHPIFYRDEGQGAVLLCIHGFPTASWDWYRVWDALRGHFRLVAPDLIGFGFSAKPRAYSYTIHDQATLCEALLAELGIREAYVLAHDYGDTVAQELLARQVERAAPEQEGCVLRAFCLLNGGLFPEAHRPRLIQRLLLTPLGPLVGRFLTRRSFQRSLRAIFGAHTQPSPAELDTFWSLVQHNDGARVAHLLIRYLEERERYRTRWVGALQQAAVPLRFVVGTEDPISGASMAARYRELVPHPDVVPLEGIGHYPQVEAPAQVTETLLAFIAPNHSS